MVWHLNCLLCKPGTALNPPAPRYGSQDLILMQEHLMHDHNVSQDDLRNQTNVTLAPNLHEYSLPDGRPWLRAKRV
jgi:hypothetical protein